jgi:type I restriction enzyme S subunit
VIKIGDIQNGEVSVAGMSYVSNEYGEGVDRAFDVLHGDLLIAMSGATTGKLGFNRQHNRFLLNQRVGKIDLLLVDDQFAFQYLTTKILENLAISAGSAIPNLSTSQIKEIMFPLPPIAEQSRIVTCVNELRALCADVRQRLREQQTTQSHLADALLMQEQGN